jgi:hypothetical protein
MNNYDVKKLALVLAVQAEIEGMKAANAQHPENQPYTKEQFNEKAFRLESLAYTHDAVGRSEQYCVCEVKDPEIKVMWLVCSNCNKPIKDE